jgi:hypothetical protein
MVNLAPLDQTQLPVNALSTRKYSFRVGAQFLTDHSELNCVSSGTATQRTYSYPGCHDLLDDGVNDAFQSWRCEGEPSSS